MLFERINKIDYTLSRMTKKNKTEDTSRHKNEGILKFKRNKKDCKIQTWWHMTIILVRIAR